ncbi:MAG TPA: metallophosphoesterase [Candidatus Limnocylindria bacterium]|nr:metallophosphoesterase [Candidatus Limnocylindria bacterium]
MNGTVRVAAAGDLHCTKDGQGALAPLFAAMSERADVIALCGDLTDYGLPDEARVLAAELRAARVPVVAVLGNHDLESGHAEEVRTVLEAAGVRILDGDAVEIEGVGFAGTKGFAGGFGQHALGPWGETVIKAFVQEAVDESLKLESALARLRTTERVVLLHYAPIAETVSGEPKEIYPFLGSSRLAEPIDRYGASIVLHGHAHHGHPEGRTAKGIPVHNVSLPLLRRMDPGGPGFRVLELARAGAEVEA